MKVAFNDVNIIIMAKKTFGKCSSCCFSHKRGACFNRELRHGRVCNNWYTLDINIDDIFKL